jgi:peroxiredoxin
MTWSRALTLLLFFCLGSARIFSAGTPVKDFSLPSATDGRLLHLADFSSKVVLINWWRTDCSDAKRESPRLVELYKKHHQKGFEILGVSDDNSKTVAQIPAYLKHYGITWPIGLNDQREFLRELRPRDMGGTPANYLVSRSGELTALGQDLNDASWLKLEEAVTRALAEPVPSSPQISRRALESAAPLSLPDLQGRTVKLANFAGKPLVVNFFNAQNCDWTGAVFAKLHNDYGSRGFQIVGIDLLDHDAQLKACVAKYGARYLVLRGDQATLDRRHQGQGYIFRHARWKGLQENRGLEG